MTAAFACRFEAFNATTALEKLGTLIAATTSLGFATHYSKQTEAWEAELGILGDAVSQIQHRVPGSRDWSLFIEFQIPRRGKRPDVVILADDLIFVIEFKIGAPTFGSTDIWQTMSYALDLRDFHLGSVGRRVVPVLLATEAANDPPDVQGHGTSLVTPVVLIGGVEGSHLADGIERLYRSYHDISGKRIDPDTWVNAPYRPIPTIIEAAEELFAGHGVANISHSFATNLDVTSRVLVEAIQRAQAQQQRLICFVTGIPGAGKTLTGLNAVHDPTMRGQGRPAAVFLSGNGPLVKIVREALIRDRQRAGMQRPEAARTVSTFIDNVHRFVVTYGLERTSEPPYENAIVFDEAQRAWDSDAVARRHHVRKSEPQLVMEIMERSPDWSVIIALVGGGQEIHRGEAGLGEWGRALSARHMEWQVLVSPEALQGGPSVAGHRLFAEKAPSCVRVTEIPELHLNVSVRSPRARRIGEWVNSLLTDEVVNDSGDPDFSGEFPIVLTRELEGARQWLREHNDGSQRCGLLASSGALRLRAEGIELSSGFRRAYSYEDWFLSGSEDTRSSLWLEVAATEFECQGLELDWTGVCWGGDFLRHPRQQVWSFRKFRGTKWQSVRQEHERRYVANKYRVLLTRARRGMVIWVPQGNPEDCTRDPAGFEATAKYLETRGISII